LPSVPALTAAIIQNLALPSNEIGNTAMWQRYVLMEKKSSFWKASPANGKKGSRTKKKQTDYKAFTKLAYKQLICTQTYHFYENSFYYKLQF
jgi:hypothetical protein